jgi:hypothetical protein
MTKLVLKTRVIGHESADDRTIAQMEHASMGEPICDGSETGELSAAYTLVPGGRGYVYAVDSDDAQYLFSFDPDGAAPEKADVVAAIAATKEGSR